MAHRLLLAQATAQLLLTLIYLSITAPVSEQMHNRRHQTTTKSKIWGACLVERLLFQGHLLQQGLRQYGFDLGKRGHSALKLRAVVDVLKDLAQQRVRNGDMSVP